MNLKPIKTEKAIMMIESENTLVFETEKERNKQEIKKELEDLFKIKIEKIRTHIKKNKKYAYVKLKKEYPSIEVATKIKMI